MPLLQLLMSYHEGRVDLCLPFLGLMEGLLRVPVAPLLQQAQQPVACATNTEK